MKSMRLVLLNLQKISTCKYTEIAREYDTAHLKLDTHFGLFACVQGFIPVTRAHQSSYVICVLLF